MPIPSIPLIPLDYQQARASTNRNSPKIPDDSPMFERWATYKDPNRLMRSYANICEVVHGELRIQLDNQLAFNLFNLAFQNQQRRASAIQFLKERSNHFQEKNISLFDFKVLVENGYVDLGFLEQVVGSPQAIPRSLKKMVIELCKVIDVVKKDGIESKFRREPTEDEALSFLNRNSPIDDLSIIDFSEVEAVFKQNPRLKSEFRKLLQDPLMCIYRHNKTINTLCEIFAKTDEKPESKPKTTDLFSLFRNYSTPYTLTRLQRPDLAHHIGKATIDHEALETIYKLQTDNNFGTEHPIVLPKGGTIIALDLQRSTLATSGHLRTVQELPHIVADLLIADMRGNVQDKYKHLLPMGARSGDGNLIYYPGTPSPEVVATILNLVQKYASLGLHFREGFISANEVPVHVQKSQNSKQIHIQNASDVDAALKKASNNTSQEGNGSGFRSLVELQKGNKSTSNHLDIKSNTFFRIQPPFSNPNQVVYNLSIVCNTKNLSELEQIYQRIKVMVGEELSDVYSPKSIICDQNGRPLSFMERGYLEWQNKFPELNLPKIEGNHIFVEVAVIGKGSIMAIENFLKACPSVDTFSGRTSDFCTLFNTAEGLVPGYDRAFNNSKQIKKTLRYKPIQEATEAS